MTQQKKNFNLKVGDKIDYKVIKHGYKTVNGTINVTEDLDNLTQITLDPSSKIYNSNLDYTIDTSGLYPPIITFNQPIILPDDNILPADSYVYAPYGKEYEIYDDNNIHRNNFMTVGTISVTKDGIVSNFNSINRIQTDLLDFGLNDYEIIIGFKIGTQTNDWQTLIHCDIDHCFNISVSPELKIHSCSGDSYEWQAATLGTTTLELNKEYLVKVIRTSGIRSVYISDNDGETWSEEGSIADEYSYSKAIRFGTRPDTTGIFTNGIIYLKKTYIKINNEYAWKPTLESYVGNFWITNQVAIKDRIASNFYSSQLFFRKYESSDTFQFITKIKINNTGHNQYIFHDYVKGNVVIILDSSGYVRSFINGSWIAGTVQLTPNKWYWLKLDVINRVMDCYVKEYNDENQCPENIVMTKSFTVTNGTSFIGHYFNIGGYDNNTGEWFDGSIDLDKTCFITGNTKYKPYETYKRNYNTVYAPLSITDDHIVSGFSTSRYIRLDKIFNPGNKPWKMQFKIRQEGTQDSWRALMGSYGSDYTCGAHFYVSSGGHLSFELHHSSSWDITGTGGRTSDIFTMSANKWYLVQLEFTGTAYKSYISEDGLNFINIYTLETTSNIVATQNQCIGCDQYAGGSQYFNGSIDLKESWIKIEDEYFWNPVERYSKVFQGILDSAYIDTGDEVTLNLYDIQTDKRNLILNTNTNHNVNNIKFQEYIDTITIPEHGLSIYENDMWSKRREVTLTVDDENVDIYTEGNV